MTHDHDHSDLVRISLPGPNAVSEPIFLIKVGDVFYATLSVWEYNLAKAETEEQKEGFHQVADYYHRHASEGGGHAITLKIGDPPSMTSTTRPPHPKPAPTRPPVHRPSDPPPPPPSDPPPKPVT